MQTLESILNNFLEGYLFDCFVCLPAVVVGVQNLNENRIDVQPLPTKMFKDNTSAEYPNLLNVPVVFPQTTTSALTLKINQGDNVLLVFSQSGIDEFKGGSTTPYQLDSKRFMSLNDAFAIVGITPFNKSPNNPKARTLPHSVNDTCLVTNIGTDKECEVRLKEDGSVKITSSIKVTIDSPETEITNTLTVLEDAVIAGTSFNLFKTTHTHNYTDDGNLLTTLPANPI